MKEYRRSYKLLVAWTLALIPVMLGAAMLAEKAGMDDRGMIAMMMTAVVLMLLVLMWMIWKGEYVYWINGGPSFEEAKAAGSDVRREFAWRHLTAMLKGSAATLALLSAEWLLGAHELVMVLTVGAGSIASVIPMMKIKWPEVKHDSQN